MKRTDSEVLSAAIRSFLGDYLPHQRACSAQTILSYRDSLKLLLKFAAGTRYKVTEFTVALLSSQIVTAFLDHLESKRRNSVATRNVRLTAIHSFFEYLGREHPEHLLQAQRILSIPFKRATQRTVDYLDAGELRRVLEAVDRSTPMGRRDYLLLTVLFNTGARVQEVDMFAFAEACLFKVPYVAPALRRRFPWVFIDELQDTSRMQDSVVEAIFAAEGCIFQRFGDKNQAIFDFDSDSDGGQSLFGRRKILFLNGTHRFGSSIAAFTSRLTAVEPQTLVGNPGLPDLENTVFVFDRAAVGRVVPSFGNLVLKTVPPEILKEKPVCVVGNRVNAAQHTRDNFPAFLGDYGNYYVSPRSAKPPTPDTFLGYIVESRKKWAETGTGAEPYNLAISGVLALLRRTLPNEAEALPRTKTTLHQAVMQNGCFSAFQKLIWQLLNPVNTLDERKWTACMKEFLILFRFSNPPQEVLNFLVWENCAGAMPEREAKSAIQTEGIYLHRAGDVSLPIRFDSIHGVKGETHAATLVVETFARQHDLKELLPVLTAAQHGSQMRDSARGHCKRVFVGMSRPSHLLCLAISAEHIADAQIMALATNGWKIEKIRA